MIETSSARGTIWSFFLFKTKMARAKGWINQIDYINVFFLRISEFPWSSCEGSWIYLNKEVHGTCLFRYLFVFSRAARSHKKHMFVLWGLGKEKKGFGCQSWKRKHPKKSVDRGSKFVPSIRNFLWLGRQSKHERIHTSKQKEVGMNPSEERLSEHVDTSLQTAIEDPWIFPCVQMTDVHAVSSGP